MEEFVCFVVRMKYTARLNDEPFWRECYSSCK